MFYPSDKNNKNGSAISCIESEVDAIPEFKNRKISEKGVSTNSIQSPLVINKNREKARPHWYALRATYGQERKAYDYIISKNGIAFYPTKKVCRLLKNKRVFQETSMLPNMLFAYGTEEEIKSFVYDNVNLPFLRFYYSHHHENNIITKTPTIIPDYQMEDLKIICSLESSDIILSPDKIEKFEIGQKVRVIDGDFKGVIGNVARYKGQQRVGIVIENFYTIATAYIPTAFLQKY